MGDVDDEGDISNQSDIIIRRAGLESRTLIAEVFAETNKVIHRPKSNNNFMIYFPLILMIDLLSFHP